MGVALQLMQAVLAECGGGPAAAVQALEDADVNEIDPLSFAIFHEGLSEEEVYARAARFCGLAFSPTIPEPHSAVGEVARIGLLRECVSVRATVFDREVIFVAPSFEKMLALSTHVSTDPDMIGQICVVPPRALRQALCRRHVDPLIDHARQNMARVWRKATAHLDLSRAYRFGFVITMLGFVLAATLAPFQMQPVLVPLLLVLLLLPACFRVIVVSAAITPDHGAAPVPLSDGDLPVYSVLVPLRDEAGMVPQIAAALRALDYPAAKLDIKFIVEAVSIETVAAVERELHTPQFELLVVPDALPRTKPKALNFALPFLRGTYAVVFDAEDIPAPGQLRRAGELFALWPDVDCIQAELFVDNAEENWLTALFAAEYSALFGLTLPAIAQWGLPMPLGGTSNHFRTAVLDRIGGWDAFNVTEDADIGVRLARLRLRTRTMSPVTAEEAPNRFGGWMRQRTRWMKGWMQTYLVHNRHPVLLFKELGWRNFLALEIHVAGVILTPLLHTVFSLTLIVRFALGQTMATGPGEFWIHLQLAILLIGNGTAALLSLLGAQRLGSVKVMLAQCLLPLYWALIGLAALRASWELLVRPHVWAKTAHGTTRLRRGLSRYRRAEGHRQGVERVKGIEPSS